MELNIDAQSVAFVVHEGAQSPLTYGAFCRLIFTSSMRERVPPLVLYRSLMSLSKHVISYK